MITHVPISPGPTLDDYARVLHLARAVAELRAEAARLVPKLAGRRVWMVNSTAQGGGVAEMLPRVLALLIELGVDARWVVIGAERPEFFSLTKTLHNWIHGQGEGELSLADYELYRSQSAALAAELAPHIAAQDILVIHDPQPAGVGAILRQSSVGVAVWRCHIGLDEPHPRATRAWQFLEPYLEAYDHAVFSAAPYVPPCLAGRSTIISPGIDPFSHKNRDLSPHKLVGILCNAGLMGDYEPVLTPPFEDPVQRLHADGTFKPMQGSELGLLFRPTVTQVSRWDRLKGFAPLLDGFVVLKQALARAPGLGDRERRRLDLARLVLAGPEPASVQDDPEAADVLRDLARRYRNLPHDVQRDIAVLSLPMQRTKENSLIVNALQRCSSIVVQNSLREGFGLTVTEAMWKHVAVLGTTAAGIRQQIRHGIEGFLNPEPENPELIASTLARLLNDPHSRTLYAQNAQRRVHDELLIFVQLSRWLHLLASL
jgi:trehalose synthase